MHPGTQVRRVGCARAAALLAIFSVVSISSREALAQLGSLVVTMTAPTAGSTVSGSITAGANVSVIGALTVVGVQFQLDGVNLGAEDGSAPYAIPWNTRTASNGSHRLTAVARDLLGARWTSQPVTVTVFNDTTPPVVNVTTPTAGSTLRGTVAVNANASDNVGVVGVQFLVDGAPLGSEDTTAPYSVTWNTATASNSAHALTARARDAAGNVTTSVAATVTVDNALPTVTIASPAGGATVSGSVTVTASAADNVGVTGVQFRLDGASLGAEDTTAPYSFSWNTTSIANGAHTLTAVARDGASNQTTSAAVAVTVSNDTTPPTVSMSSPPSGFVVSGTWLVQATASDNVAVVGVQFRMDGADLGAEDTTAPYSVTWNTGTTSSGSHTLTAVARDAAGNRTTAATVTGTADNTPPTTAITAPASGATVSGTMTISASASDNVGIRDVRLFADGVQTGPILTASPYSVAWDTTKASNASHTLTARTTDTAGNVTTSAPITITVSNDTSLPTVTITSPASGASVGGTITVTASASDDVGVAGVEFRLDGVSLAAEDADSAVYLLLEHGLGRRRLAHLDRRCQRCRREYGDLRARQRDRDKHRANHPY